MNENKESPDPVNIIRRILAVVIFMAGMFLLIILSCVAGYKDSVRKRLDRLYDLLFETILKINPNFHDA